MLQKPNKILPNPWGINWKSIESLPNQQESFKNYLNSPPNLSEINEIAYQILQKLIKILHRYESLKEKKGKTMMENLLTACETLKKEPWFDLISATVIVQFLAEIAEADHQIEKTEVQLLENLANVFGVKPPRI